MAELAFAKSFLALLETKPPKLRSDHVFDPRSFQVRHAFTLPKLNASQHPPMPKRVKTAEVPGASKSVTIHLKSARNPVLDVTLDKAPLSSTTIQDLKEAVQARIKPTNGDSGSAKVPLDKIKILWKKKPVQGKTVAEALADETALLGGGGHAEFGVMVLGGATALSAEEIQAAEAAAAADTTPSRGLATQRPPESGTQDVEMKDASVAPEQTPSARSVDEVLGQPAFWDDLQDFLRAKVQDEQEAARLKSLFRSAWESSR
ncbi:hypothetical protein VTO42DRAFT_6370 [Malbranchea cinnamomea]